MQLNLKYSSPTVTTSIWLAIIIIIIIALSIIKYRCHNQP